jgi:hypothetical protein
MLRPIAERRRARLVLADRFQHLAERRVDRAVHDHEAEQENAEHREVHRERRAEIDQPEEHAARYGLDAVLTVRELRLQREEEHHLRECEGDVREVDAAAADRERADGQPEQGRHPDAEEDRGLGRPAPYLRRMRRRVAGTAEERGVPEREQPHVPDQEVERAREEREAEGLHEEHGVDEERRRDEQRDHHDERDHLVARDRGGGRAGGGAGNLVDGGRHYRSRPNSPLGFTKSTRAMMTKMTVLDASG